MQFVLFFIIFICYLYFTNPYVKGHRGELKVAKLLSKLSSTEYSVINSIILQNDKKTFQIDHLIISLYGIFVIETKNYSGWIMGGEKSDQWIKNVYGHKYYFYNPIKQNNSHILALSKKLKIPKENFISIIAFSHNANIKIQTNENVIYFKEILPTILSYSKKIFTLSDIDIITNKLLKNQLHKKEEIKSHIEYAKRQKHFSQMALEQGICPYCGNSLILREGKYGRFIGCSKYPKCKYTHPL